MYQDQVVNEQGHIVYPDEIRSARERTSGDDFDVGKSVESIGQSSGINFDQGMTGALLMGLLANPGSVFGNVSPRQAENLRSLIVGSGTGGVVKILSKHLGTKTSAVIGSLLAAYIADKVVRE